MGERETGDGREGKRERWERGRDGREGEMGESGREGERGERKRTLYQHVSNKDSRLTAGNIASISLTTDGILPAVKG
jgi:hypothetical protein